MNIRNKLSCLTYNAIFSTLSLVLAFLGNFTLFPIFPFLKADFSDTPVYLATLMISIPSGITTLIVTSFIKAIFFSSSGYIGFVMRLPPIIMIIFLSISKNKKIFEKIFYITLGILISIFCKIVLNYFFWINFFNISRETINSLLMVIILPYNILKTIVCLILALLIYKRLDNKYTERKIL